LGLYLFVAAIGRRPRVYLGWFAAVALACLVEAVDARDDLAWFGHWRWKESAHDVINTLVWPTVLTGLWAIRSRYRPAHPLKK